MTLRGDLLPDVVVAPSREQSGAVDGFVNAGDGRLHADFTLANPNALPVQWPAGGLFATGDFQSSAGVDFIVIRPRPSDPNESTVVHWHSLSDDCANAPCYAQASSQDWNVGATSRLRLTAADYDALGRDDVIMVECPASGPCSLRVNTEMQNASLQWAIQEIEDPSPAPTTSVEALVYEDRGPSPFGAFVLATETDRRLFAWSGIDTGDLRDATLGTSSTVVDMASTDAWETGGAPGVALLTAAGAVQLFSVANDTINPLAATAPPPLSGAISIRVVDLDEDGFVDLVASTASRLHWARNLQSTGFQDFAPLTSEGSSRGWFDVGDLDDPSSKPDLVTVGSDRTLRVHLQR